MKWSFDLGKVAGISLRVHATFLLLLAWAGFRALQADAGLSGAAYEIAFMLAVFGSVVLHELGHALTARRFGIRTRDITLLPIGGVANLQVRSMKPRTELWVALAGPAVNVAITAAIALMGAFMPLPDFLWNLAAVNVALAVFNMIPAFPMDGGRVLRAALSKRWGKAKATRTAANIGKVFAVAFAVWAIASGNPVMLLISIFLWVTGGMEARAAQPPRAVPVQVVYWRDPHGRHPGHSFHGI